MISGVGGGEGGTGVGGRTAMTGVGIRDGGFSRSQTRSERRRGKKMTLKAEIFLRYKLNGS